MNPGEQIDATVRAIHLRDVRNVESAIVDVLELHGLPVLLECLVNVLGDTADSKGLPDCTRWTQAATAVFALSRCPSIIDMQGRR